MFAYQLKKNKQININYKILLIVIVIIFVLVFLFSPMFSKYVEKIGSIFEDFSDYYNAKIVNSYSYSNYLRLFKSWHTYMDLHPIEKVIGLGINNFMNYLKTTTITFKWNTIWDNNARMAAYYTSAGGVFIDCGLIVALYYYIFLIKKYIHAKSFISKTIIVILVIQSFFTQIFFNNIFVYYFILYNAFRNDENVYRGNE